MGKIPEAIRAPLLRRVDKVLAALLISSLALHFGCVGYLRSLDFPRDSDVPRAVTFRPQTVHHTKEPEQNVASKDEPAQKDGRAAKIDRGASDRVRKVATPSRPKLSDPAASDPGARRAMLAERMRRAGILDVITARGDGSVGDVLKHGGAPADADDVWKSVSRASTQQSSKELLKPREAAGPEIKRGARLISRGPNDATVGEREGEQGPVAPAGRRPEVDHEAPTDTGGALPANPDDVWREVRARLSAIKACYFQAIRITPGVHGKLVMRLDVAASGEVSHVSFTHDTVRDVGLGMCLRLRANGWKLPPSTGAYHFSLPLVFVTR